MKTKLRENECTIYVFVMWNNNKHKSTTDKTFAEWYKKRFIALMIPNDKCVAVNKFEKKERKKKIKEITVKISARSAKSKRFLFLSDFSDCIWRSLRALLNNTTKTDNGIPFMHWPLRSSAIYLLFLHLSERERERKKRIYIYLCIFLHTNIYITAIHQLRIASLNDCGQLVLIEFPIIYLTKHFVDLFFIILNYCKCSFIIH